MYLRAEAYGRGQPLREDAEALGRNVVQVLLPSNQGLRSRLALHGLETPVGT